MTWVATAIVGGSLISGVLGSNAASSAADTQAAAAKYAADVQQNMFNTVNAQAAPWRQSGQNALGVIAGGIGVGPSTGGVPSGYFTHQFNANDLKTSLAPNYDFMLQQGLGAIKNAGNATTGLLSGNTLKGITDYAENYAGNAYQNAFNNYTTNQQNIFNRLSTIAGFGTTANQTVAPVASSAASGIGNAAMAGGQAAASGIVGSTNAITGAINNATSWYSLPYLMNGGFGGSYTSAQGGG